MSGKNYVFTDCDLDGVGSYLVSKWLISDLPYKVSSQSNFRKDFLTWVGNNKLSDYDTIYIFDINVSNHSDILDYDNVVIIDHHNGKEGYVNFVKAKLILDQDYSSTTKLVLKTFLQQDKSLISKLSPSKAKLITLIDDYDSYTLKHPESVGLNIVLWSYTGDRIDKFITEFGNGFVPFNNFQLNMISIAEKKINEAVNTSDIFSVTLPVEGKQRKIICVQCNHNINEVISSLILQFNADIGLVVNLKSKRVSLRKSRKCNVNLSKLAEKICDGGGHYDSAGGVINDKFLMLSKMFKKI